MNVYVMHCPFHKKGKYDIFHYSMFHGELKVDKTMTVVNPLSITRNGRIVPDITCPLNHLIVSERARVRLKDLPWVEFRGVVFEKLVDYEWRLGDFSHYDEDSICRPTPLDEDPGNVIETPIQRLPDVPSLHERIGQFYEMLVPMYRDEDVLSAHGATARRTLALPEALEHLSIREISISQAMIDEVPIFLYYEHFVNDRFLDAVGDLLDKDFFVVAKVG